MHNPDDTNSSVKDTEPIKGEESVLDVRVIQYVCDSPVLTVKLISLKPSLLPIKQEMSIHVKDVYRRSCEHIQNDEGIDLGLFFIFFLFWQR